MVDPHFIYNRAVHSDREAFLTNVLVGTTEEELMAAMQDIGFSPHTVKPRPPGEGGPFFINIECLIRSYKV